MNENLEPQDPPNPGRTALKIILGVLVVFAVVVLLLFGACVMMLTIK